MRIHGDGDTTDNSDSSSVTICLRLIALKEAFHKDMLGSDSV